MWDDGTKFEGVFKNDNAHGSGRIINSDGSIYQGNWFENHAHGLGMYINN